ncbi:MAG TPA: VanW family protein, partial [Polyangiales bacterium]
MWGKVRSASAEEWVAKTCLGLCAAGAAALVGSFVLPEPAAQAASSVPVLVAGEAIDPSGNPAAQAQAVAHRYLAQPVTLTADKLQTQLTRGQLGARVDTAHLAALLSAAADPRSPLRRVHAQTLREQAIVLPMPIEVDDTRSKEWLARLKDRVDEKPVEPKLDPRRAQLTPPQPGLALDVLGTLERIDRALGSGEREVQIALLPRAPKLAASNFDHVQMRAVLGEFETRYNRANTSLDRTQNLKVAAAKLDGYLLQPGETFDFNAVVGDRTAQNGFKLAPVIADGELTSGMGGGTCQIASTLHAAVFFAGLPIVMRYPHSRPSFYIKLGLDATVVYGSQNFRFKNDRAYPVVLGMQVQEGRVYASVHGPQRDHTVTLIRHVDAVVPFEEHVTRDSSLPSGLRVLAQRGVPGFKITRFRVV